MSSNNNHLFVSKNKDCNSVSEEIKLEKIITRPIVESIETSTIALHTRCLSAIPIDLEEVLKELESK